MIVGEMRRNRAICSGRIGSAETSRSGLGSSSDDAGGLGGAPNFGDVGFRQLLQILPRRLRMTWHESRGVDENDVSAIDRAPRSRAQ